MEVVSNIICYIFTRKTPLLLKKICQGIFPTNMLETLYIRKGFVSDVYMDNIADMICNIHHLHL